MKNQITTAFRTLTIIPIPGKNTNDFRGSITMFPVIGFFLGAVVYASFCPIRGIGFEGWALVSGILLGLITVLTGVLHVDGLGDVADAFGGGKSRVRVLEILKDSRMGTFGIVAIVFDIGLKWVCWHSLMKDGEVLIIVASLVLGRCMQSIYLIFLPNARNDGMAASFGGIGRGGKLMVILSSVFAIGVLCYLLSYLIVGTFLIGSIIAAILFAIMCIKKIGGITGDCVGAVNEITEIVVLLVGVVITFYII